MLSTIDNLPDKDLEEFMLPVVYFLWNQYNGWAFLMAIVYWVMIGFAYTLFTFYPKRSDILGVYLLFNLLFLLMEILSIPSVGWQNYYVSIWNWFDLFVLIFSCGIAIAGWSHRIDANMPFIVFLRMVACGLLYLRAFSFLRIKKQTRYLVTMVLEVFIDLIPFLLIFIGALVGFTFIWYLSPLLTSDGQVNSKQMTEAFYQMVMLIYGNGPSGDTNPVTGETENYGVIRLILISLANVVLSLCFLNFLISVISGTFNKFQERRDLHDLKPIISILTEAMAFKKVWHFIWQVLTCNCGKKRKKASSEKLYLLTLHPETEEEVIAKSISDDLKKVNEKIESIDAKFTAQISRTFEEKIQRLIASFDQQISNNAPHSSENSSNQTDSKSKFKEEMSLITEAINGFKEKLDKVTRSMNETKKPIADQPEVDLSAPAKSLQGPQPKLN